jgi:hypothetical protein
VRYSDILLLLAKNQSATDWVQINNENLDGGSTSFCKEDVFLTISFSVIWKKAEPFASYQLRYGSTTFEWFELPVVSANELPSFAELLAVATKHVTNR